MIMFKMVDDIGHVHCPIPCADAVRCIIIVDLTCEEQSHAVIEYEGIHQIIHDYDKYLWKIFNNKILWIYMFDD